VIEEKNEGNFSLKGRTIAQFGRMHQKKYRKKDLAVLVSHRFQY
jgi:hypothetical protein